MINPNDPVFPTTEYGDTNISSSTGIPLKLELAARFLAAQMAQSDIPIGMYAEATIKTSLEVADALINEFNNQQKEKK